MKALVTGGAGFIGSYIVDELVRRGHSVRIFDSLDPQVHANRDKPDYLNPEAEFIQGDVRDKDALQKALQDQEVVFHKAAAVGVGQSQYRIKHYVDVNTGGTANLLDLLANTNHSVQKLIVASSQTSYGEGYCECSDHGRIKPEYRSEEQLQNNRWEHECPHCGAVMKTVPTPEDAPLACKSIYALTKRDQEDMSLSIGGVYKIPVAAFRYFNVYGPRQSLSNPYTGVIAIFMSRLANGKQPVIYEDGRQSRDFISVHDIVQANMLAMEKEAANGLVFNVGSEKATSIREIALLLAEIYGVNIQPEITGQYRKNDTRHCTADISRIRAVLSFQPSVSLRQGLQEVVDWSRGVKAEDHFEKAARELSEKGLV
ncbi:MAG: SDR family NAD(P)-dependent oxidoreductase [Candidatus Omnitrophica bacterium]|nr:SDR family NAD(P)-dependent oxidoreductase [Candidatus Omnitrophota bacterium]